MDEFDDDFDDVVEEGMMDELMLHLSQFDSVALVGQAMALGPRSTTSVSGGDGGGGGGGGGSETSAGSDSLPTTTMDPPRQQQPPDGNPAMAFDLPAPPPPPQEEDPQQVQVRLQQVNPLCCRRWMIISSPFPPLVAPARERSAAQGKVTLALRDAHKDR